MSPSVKSNRPLRSSRDSMAATLLSWLAVEPRVRPIAIDQIAGQAIFSRQQKSLGTRRTPSRKPDQAGGIRNAAQNARSLFDAPAIHSEPATLLPIMHSALGGRL